MKKLLVISLVLISCAQHASTDAKLLDLSGEVQEVYVSMVAQNLAVNIPPADIPAFLAALSTAEYDSDINDTGIMLKMTLPKYSIGFTDYPDPEPLTLWAFDDGRARILWQEIWYILPAAQFAIINEILDRLWGDVNG